MKRKRKLRFLIFNFSFSRKMDKKEENCQKAQFDHEKKEKKNSMVMHEEKKRN